jgi:hypothetical protein
MSKKQKKPNKPSKRGRFSTQEDEFIQSHYRLMTDRELAASLNRTKEAVFARRRVLQLTDKNAKQVQDPEKYRAAFINALPDDLKQKEILKELRSSPLYKSMSNGKVLGKQEIALYEDKWVGFLMDPSIETMTEMEKDALHNVIMAQIDEMRYRADDKLKYSREIRDCREIILKFQETLNVQRKQRLKNQNDQAVNFTNLIKELKDPNIRRIAGEEAAMLKFIAEKFYNDKLGTNILSGKNNPYDQSIVFKDGVVPSGLKSNFTG